MNPEDLIVPALRREAVPWPTGATDTLEEAVVAAAAHHGVAALLADAPAVKAWPDRVQSGFRSALRVEAVAEAVRRNALCQVLTTLGEIGIRPLLLKGAHVAYTHYPRPWLRPRLDTDLLVHPGDRFHAEEALRGLGYEPFTQVDGELAIHCQGYLRPNRYGFPDIIDLHWRVAHPHIFASTFAFEELERDSVPIGDLGANARGPSEAHALALACVHRVAHHDNSDRLIWLYDIHLLAGTMNPDSLQTTADLATAGRLASVCASSITQAQELFATAVSRAWLDRLRAASSSTEPSAAFLEDGQTRLRVLLSDLRALSGWRPKLRLVREHLFPPLAYMRQTYALASPALIPFAYAYRIATGFRKWVRRDQTP